MASVVCWRIVLMSELAISGRTLIESSEVAVDQELNSQN